MRKLLLAAVGIGAGLLLLAGGFLVADVLGARLNHDLPESALATPSGAWTPADRISS